MESRIVFGSPHKKVQVLSIRPLRNIVIGFSSIFFFFFFLSLHLVLWLVPAVDVLVFVFVDDAKIIEQFVALDKRLSNFFVRAFSI